MELVDPLTSGQWTHNLEIACKFPEWRSEYFPAKPVFCPFVILIGG